MTKLSSVVRREVQAADGKAYIVELRQDGIYLREKHRRKAFSLSYGYAYLRAAELEVAAERKLVSSKVVRKVSRGLLSTK